MNDLVPVINNELLTAINKGKPSELRDIAEQLDKGISAAEVILGKIFYRFSYEGIWKDIFPSAKDVWDFAQEITKRSESTVREWVNNYRYYCVDMGWTEEQLAKENHEVGWTKLRELRARSCPQGKVREELAHMKESGITRDALVERLDEIPDRWHTYKVRMIEEKYAKTLEIIRLANEGMKTTDPGEQLYNAMLKLEQYLGYIEIESQEVHQQPRAYSLYERSSAD